MSYSLTQLEHFYQVGRLSSFAKAATYLKISKAQMSQSIANLETALSQKLFHRTTRSVSLTTSGESLFPIAQKMVESRSQIDQFIVENQQVPEGNLRITAPQALVEVYLADKLNVFLNEFANIHLEFYLGSQVLNLEHEQVDLAIRLTHEPPQSKVAIRLGEYQLGYFATQTYLDNSNPIKSITDLDTHRCLVSRNVLRGREWLFEFEKERKSYIVKPVLEVDTHHVIKQTMMADQGIACLPFYIVEQELKNNSLVSLFSKFLLPKIPIYAIYQQNTKQPARLKAFIKFLKQAMIC